MKEVLAENSFLKKIAEQNGLKTTARIGHESKSMERRNYVPKQQKKKGVSSSQELIFNEINK